MLNSQVTTPQYVERDKAYDVVSEFVFCLVCYCVLKILWFFVKCLLCLNFRLRHCWRYHLLTKKLLIIHIHGRYAEWFMQFKFGRVWFFLLALIWFIICLLYVQHFCKCKKILVDAEACLRVLEIISYVGAIFDIQNQGNGRTIVPWLLEFDDCS